MAEAIPEIAATGGEVGVPGMAEAGTGAESGAAPPARPGGRGRGGRIPLPSTFGQGGGSGRRAGPRAGRAGRSVSRAKLPGSHSYQPVILAEFVVAIVVVGVSPLAGGGTSTSQAKGSASPYDTNTLKQLIAIGAAYFILALFGASERMGRYAAWFGALVLVGLGIAQYLNGDLQGVFKLLSGGTGGSAASSGSSAPATNPSVVDSGIPATQDPTSIFPTVNPGGSITPAG
jgi:hypothetical protein